MPANIRLLRYMYKNFFAKLNKCEELLDELQCTGNLIRFGEIVKELQTIIENIKEEQEIIKTCIDSVEYTLENDVVVG